jgi:NAD(P)-dependent dehydrogenase (short-subunit alcohol dehydrogenase family)
MAIIGLMKASVIVTGASSGIGRAAAQALVEADYDVLLVGRREAGLRETSGASPIAVCDVSDFSACCRAVEQARELWRDSHPVLVNSAGAAAFGPFHETPVEQIEEQVKVNLLGTMFMCRAVLPWMLEAGGGQIINVLSIASTHVFPGGSAYGASKAGALMFTRILAAEYRGQGIRVTALMPGSTATPLWEGQAFQPDRADMLSAEAVAGAIVDLVKSPKDRNVDELLLMPPKGVL